MSVHVIFSEATPCLLWKSVDAGQWKRLERGKGKGGDLKKQIVFKRRMMTTCSEEAAEKKRRRRRDGFGMWQIWRITNYLAMYILSQSSGKKQRHWNVVKHTNIVHQFWYWIGCNDCLVVVFASLKLTDNLINLIWIFMWFTTNQSVFLGVSFSEYERCKVSHRLVMFQELLGIWREKPIS